MAEQGERFTVSLQENLITVLAYNAEQGRILANTLNTNLMDGDYRTVADAILDYWKKYDKPPEDHVADLVAHITEDKGNRRAKGITRILRGMVQLSDSLNTEYVVRQAQLFARMQRIKAAVIDSAEKINSNQHLAITEIEDIWNDLLANKMDAGFVPGLKGSDHRSVIEALQLSESEFSNGIPILDKKHVIPARKELFMWLGASGRGKTWALVKQGVQALKDRKKVLHISLEMSEPRVLQRYYQCMFNVARRDVPVSTISLDIKKGILKGLEPLIIKPEFALDNAFASEQLSQHIKRTGGRFDRLWVKSFPSGTLTLNGLRAYLDMLEATEKFVPDLLIVDYPGIMQHDPKDIRTSMSLAVLGIRGIAVERNLAACAAHQSNREGADARMIKATHVAEAWPIVHHSDNIVTFSSSDREFRQGLCRGFVAKSRNEDDKFGFLMTQSYKVGQFCIESHWLQKSYFDYLEDLPDNDNEDDEEGGESETVAEVRVRPERATRGRTAGRSRKRAA